MFGMLSLQSRIGMHAMPTTPTALFSKWPKSFADTLTVISSSGESFILAALCMCTDYSSFLIELPLFDGQLLRLSGVSFMSDSGALRCQRCKRMRPSRFTSASTA